MTCSFGFSFSQHILVSRCTAIHLSELQHRNNWSSLFSSQYIPVKSIIPQRQKTDWDGLKKWILSSSFKMRTVFIPLMSQYSKNLTFSVTPRGQRGQRMYLCQGKINHCQAESLGQTITPLIMHVHGEAGEIHCCAPSDNNRGFQRPQSLISSPCYQGFYPLERGRSTAPVPQP